MEPILRDPALDQQLLERGYVVIPFLSEGEVTSLKGHYYQYYPGPLEGMAATAHLPDLNMRMLMNDTIKRAFEGVIAETLVNVNPLGGSYIAKGKGQRGTLTPHQDWNIVDEEQFRSFNIWVPLVDLNDDNGVICVMPKSHTWLKSYRSANIGSAYSGVDTLLWDKMTRLYMKAGEALIYDHRLIHASGENMTDEIRLATVYGIIPKGAGMFYYHKKDDASVEVYESNKEFFLYENIFDGPKKLKKTGELPYTFPEVTSKQFKEFERGLRPGLLSRLMSLIGS